MEHSHHQLCLIKTTSAHIVELMQWFPTHTALRLWGGPQFCFPFDRETFERDLCLQSHATYSMLNAQGSLIAFGQYYQRLGRCHLGRLGVAPGYRGLGVIQSLINSLAQKGLQEFNVKEASLFVFENNQSAIKAYQKANFKVTQYPDLMLMEDCVYMIKTPN